MYFNPTIQYALRKNVNLPALRSIFLKTEFQGYYVKPMKHHNTTTFLVVNFKFFNAIDH